MPVPKIPTTTVDPGEDLYFAQPKGAFKNNRLVWDQYHNPLQASSPASFTAANPVGVDGFSLTPAPQSGTGAFGLIPGPIGAPNPYKDLGDVFPNLSGVNAQTSATLLSRLRGELSPGAKAAIEDASSTYGVTSGMPGSGVSRNRTLRDIGRLSEDVQSKAMAEYPSILDSVSRTQTLSPALQAEIAGTNATNAAAPNPANQAYYARWLFERMPELMPKAKGPGFGSLLGGAAGAGAGAFLGGPAGATAGFGIGSGAGKFLPF